MEKTDFLQYPLLAPLSAVYGGVMCLRADLYQRGFLKSYRLPIPVISVGNLSVGGTGKTPVVRWLAGALLEKGRRPAVLIRGYGGDESPEPRLVPADRRQQSALRYGDEACLLASALPQAAVITGTDRVRSGSFAIEEHRADVLLLDDGYQHLRMRRDLNICVMGPELVPENARVLPSGRLREKAAALSRADIVWVNAAREQELPDETALARMFKSTGRRPVIGSIREPAGLIQLDPAGGRKPAPVDGLKGARAVLVSGIANPGRFRETVEGCGARVLLHECFPDHHPLTPENLEQAAQIARKTDCEWLLMTEKDAVRLGDLLSRGWQPPESPRLGVLDIRLRIARGLEELMALIDRALEHGHEAAAR